MIETRLLEALVAFDEYGTLSRAAEHLHIAQPSVSRAIQSLEHEMRVPLIDRTKNTATINENGRLTVEYAKRILSLNTEMVQAVRTLERSRYTLSVGYCAPGPQMLLLPQLMTLFPDLTIQSEILNEEEILHRGILDSHYQLIVTTQPSSDQRLISIPYTSEQLYLALPENHHLYEKSSITFDELDGEPFLVVTDLGIWDNIIHKKMPKSKFFTQSSFEAFDIITQSSSLASFSTDISQKILIARKKRRNIPITDTIAMQQYYIICTKKEAARLKPLLSLFI